MKEKDTPQTPMLKQYFEIKAQYPEALLLYRVGDFYETYGEDALTASRVLGLVLTRKSAGSGTFIEMAGIPHHAIDNYMPRLVQAGYKVAVCDQLEDPKLTKKLVKRGVTELITPGVAYNDNLLKAGENNYLAAFCFSGKQVGMAFLDISTGTFKLAQGTLDYAEVLLSTLAPHEVLVERSFVEGFRKRFGDRSACITPLDPWAFVPDAAYKKVCTQLGTGSLKGFGVEGMLPGIAAAGATLFYLEMTQHTALGHIRAISRIDEGDFVWMDRFTFRNLEVFESLAGAEGRSLIEAIGRCCTPMGGRLLREWLSMPLKDIARLNARYDTVDAFLADGEMCAAVRGELMAVGDLERIVAKAAAGKLLPREALQMARALQSSGTIRATIATPALENWCEALEDCAALADRIARTLLPEAAAALGKGDVIAPGVSPELDKLRDTLHGGRQILLDIQQRERDATGIGSLKIGYNNVFGYYLEVRNTFKDKVPQDWIRKQTLVGAERYITAELKQYEETILGAEQRILDLETRLYGELVAAIQAEIPAVQHNAATLAQLDVLAGFAVLARDQDYCRPVLNDSLSIDIVQGRHPVIEQMMPDGEEYVANDLHLDTVGQQIIILTGPNMAGKSAFLRQTALICLLAQTGCFVPAKRLKMGIVDKIFTRVGASDNISRGESTFMVEMLETATILNNLSDRSLVLLDEIGRGTSTFDGMSIAWAIVEHIHTHSRAKTLFATHYHELNELEKRYPRVHNFHIAVKEVDGQILFLRKLCPGGVAHSFGIHVARLAGMPSDVVYRAEKKLRELEAAAPDLSGAKTAAASASQGVQLSLYQLDDPLLLDIKDELTRIDINKLSPLDAFDALRGLKKKLGL